VRTRKLTDAELDDLTEALERFGNERAMNLEELDGFIAALICGPSTIPPSEFLSEIWGGGEMADAESFASEEDVQRFVQAVIQHWNFVAETLQSGDFHLPLLLEDNTGAAHANDWAHGFVRGMNLRREDWLDLVNDEENGGWLVPIFALAHEHHPDPELRPYKEPVDAERREQLTAGMIAGVRAIYRYFAQQRRMAAQGRTTYRRETAKVGRNDPCPCGSGRKFKHCCGKVTIH
jgi:uncharacterized protein